MTARITEKYELVAPAGEGGMASVWRGRTLGAHGFERPVAIKRVLSTLADDPHFISLFVEEARVLAGLAHPNIVQVHDFDTDNRGECFLVMEWVEGMSLSQYTDAFTTAGQKAPWSLVAYMGVQILSGLSAAHERRTDAGEVAPVIHRDVTPGNILLGNNGVVKLSDFGLARATDRKSMTKPGTVKGKLGYMSPEVLHGEKAGVRSDLYAVGICLWEALAGVRLFTGGNDIDVIMKVRAGVVPPIADHRPDLPGVLGEILHCTLAKDPDERFQTARAMRRALNSILKNYTEPLDDDALGNHLREVRSQA